MMVGESVVVVGVGGGGSACVPPLHRPRSADNLSRLPNASSLPALDDLAESEVFVGDEEDEMMLGDGRLCDDPYLRPTSLEALSPFSNSSSAGGTNNGINGICSPDLLSPTGPTPTTSLIITYEDSPRLPLDAVKEEVEAEALEEASMILSGPGSLSHVSLTSSIISISNSLDGDNNSSVSSRTETYDTVLAAPTISPAPSDTVSPPPEISRPNYAARVAAASRNSPTSPRGSSDGSSPGTPERRRKAKGTAITPRGAGAVTDRAVTRPAQSTNPRPSDKTKDDKKVKIDDKKRRIVGTTLERKPCIRGYDTSKTEKSTSFTRPKPCDKEKEPSVRKKTDIKDQKSDDGKGTPVLRRKLKSEEARKKDVRIEETSVYGTLGRRRRVKEAGDSKDDPKLDPRLSKDNKNTLDMYATLPRRKAREISARWREQLAEEEASKTSSLRRTKSVGKNSERTRGSVMSTSLPSAAFGKSRESKSINREAKSTSTTNLNPRKERTIICMETAVQTCLTGGDVTSALRALSRQSSACGDSGEEENDAKVHVPIIREMKTPEELPDSRSVEVQVELAWRLGEGELPEHVRRLTEEHTRLQTEHARARARLEEYESFKDEVEKMKVLLDEERSEKEEVQGELDRTSQRVKDMLISMEGVEHEFNSRGDSLMELESQLHQSADIHIQMQDKLNKYEEYTHKIKRDLDKSVAAQKTLLQQVQDLENEGREIADFMSEEKNALSECLREAETELVRLRKECQLLTARLKEKDEEARHMVRLAEERKNKCMVLESEMSTVQTRARDIMVCQGAEVSGAAVSLTNLSSRLHTLISKLVHDYTITDADLEMVVTPRESDYSDSSASSTNGTPEHQKYKNQLPKSPFKISTKRTPSPRKTASFISAFLASMRMTPNSKVGNHLGVESPCNGFKQMTEGRNSPEGSESKEMILHDGNSNGNINSNSNGSSNSTNINSIANMSLTDQVTDVDEMLTKLLKVCCVLKNDTDNTLNEVEEENERLCNQIRSQQQVIDQQHSDYEALSRSESRAKRDLMTTSRDLELANQNLAKFYEADHELQVMKLKEEVEKLGASSRHLEALLGEKERQLGEAMTSLTNSQTPAPPTYIPEAQHFTEVCTLNDKVTSLRQSVIERDRRISELSERHSEDLQQVREAQLTAQRTTNRLSSTVDHVLKTLESVPDIVSSSPALKQLFTTLATSEKSTAVKSTTLKCTQNNGIPAPAQNGIGDNNNEDANLNADLNANQQSIINTGLVSNITAETHL